MAFAHVQYIGAALIRICTHHECEVDKIETQAIYNYISSPAYTSVAMTTSMGCRPQCEDGAPPIAKYVHVNVNR